MRRVVRPVSTDDSVIEAAASDIAGLPPSTRIERTIAIGQIVLERICDGDEDRVCDHGRRGASMRRLADRLGDVSASMLSRCARVYIILRRCDPGLAFGSLTPSHVLAVRALPVADQEAVLRDAVERRWSARATARAARRRADAQCPTVRLLHDMDRRVNGPESDFARLDRVPALDADRALESHETAARVVEGLERVMRRLTPMVLRARSAPVLRPRPRR